jgi:hypothetical protein
VSTALILAQLIRCAYHLLAHAWPNSSSASTLMLITSVVSVVDTGFLIAFMEDCSVVTLRFIIEKLVDFWVRFMCWDFGPAAAFGKRR